MPSPDFWALLLAGALAGAASVPHCSLMCGPLAAAACTGRRATLSYALGRALGYGAAGAVAGMLGKTLHAWLGGPFVAAVLSWLIALGLAITAWALWSAGSPKLLSIRRGARLWWWGPGRWVAPFLRRPGALGAITALLPCGALGAALAVAAGSATPLAGFLVMITFALTSLPGPLGAALLGARLRRARRPWMARSLAAVFMVGAVLFAVRPVPMLQGGGAPCAAHALAHASG